MGQFRVGLFAWFCVMLGACLVMSPNVLADGDYSKMGLLLKCGFCFVGCFFLGVVWCGYEELRQIQDECICRREGYEHEDGEDSCIGGGGCSDTGYVSAKCSQRSRFKHAGSG